MKPRSCQAQEIAAELRDMQAARGGRLVAGLAGAPGSGKSTLAQQICAELGEKAVLVPQDGWHLSSELTAEMGASDQRGAPQTFDALGFVLLLHRIRTQAERATTDPPIYAPAYRRDIEEPVAGAVAIEARTPIVVVEGNYLLLNRPVWREIRPLLDVAYYVALEKQERQRRLIHRHMTCGKSRDEATRWALGSDEHNALLIESERLEPDKVVPAP